MILCIVNSGVYILFGMVSSFAISSLMLQAEIVAVQMFGFKNILRQ